MLFLGSGQRQNHYSRRYFLAISSLTLRQLDPCNTVIGSTRAMVPSCLTMRSARATNHDAMPA